VTAGDGNKYLVILVNFLLPYLSILTSIVGNDKPFGSDTLQEFKKEWKESTLETTELTSSSIP
jgi:hypothetical protein